MNIKVTYYLDVVSSWCYWAEPAWVELKRRHAQAPVEFDWQIALLDGAGRSKSREQSAWFYRRSGTITRSPFMLDATWEKENDALPVNPTMNNHEPNKHGDRASQTASQRDALCYFLSVRK
jgi:predicted DsbA family dithiol-disulfide isomerase